MATYVHLYIDIITRPSFDRKFLLHIILIWTVYVERPRFVQQVNLYNLYGLEGGLEIAIKKYTIPIL